MGHRVPTQTPASASVDCASRAACGRPFDYYCRRCPEKVCRMSKLPVNSQSLSAIIDAVEDAHFWSRPLSQAQRIKMAKSIAARLDQPHAYARTFALFDVERRNGWKLFTGERVQSAAARHIAGE